MTRRFDAVLFDWMQTLAHYPDTAGHVRLGLARLGRSCPNDEVAAIAERLDAADGLPDVQEAQMVEDTSLELHHHSEHLRMRCAGVDAELADSMYALLGLPEVHPAYPDTKAVLAAVHTAGVRVGVVSDIHVDLPRHAEVFGFSEHVDAWALSVELGVQKPDPRIFLAAIESLGVSPARTLMVGDRATRDGAAAELGVTCLILPPPAGPTEPRGLDVVLDLVGG